MTDNVEADYLTRPARIQAMRRSARAGAAGAASSRAGEGWLKLIIATAFLPQNLSLFIGDFRLPIVRVLLLVLLIPATQRFLARSRSAEGVVQPSDIIVILAGAWMLIAGVATDGLANGIKGAGALIVDFVGAYYVFRGYLEARDSSIRMIKFSAWVMVIVTALALLDPLMGRLFTQETVAHLTGRSIYYDMGSGAIFRNGLVRAMGPMEHSILFGAAASWFAVLVLGTFGLTRFAVVFGLIEAVGCWFTQSRASFAVLLLGFCLLIYEHVMKRFRWRWQLVIFTILSYFAVVFLFSRNPVATLLTFGGLDPEAGWYREIIWGAAGPLVLGSPIFGLGLGDDNWNWRAYDGLVGASVDSLWLRGAMLFGIPGILLVFSTIVSPLFAKALDRSSRMSSQERNLSAALGVVAGLVILLGFAVHFWGTTWILLGIFPAIRAHLAEASATRSRPGARRRR